MHAEFRYAARASRSGRRRLFFATLFVLVLVLLDLLSGGKVRALARNAASSVWDVGSRAWSGISGSGYLSSRASLEAQISTLRDQLQQAQGQAATADVLQQENDALSRMTHLAQTTTGITAPIVSSIQSSPYGTFLVGAGSADGVSAGSLVLTPDDFVVGKVAQVGAHQSLVDETFASGSQTDVVIDGAAAAASGVGGGNARAQVSHGITVQVGDPVIAPEYGARAVGIVGHVVSDPASAQSQLYIALPVSLSSLKYVYITP
jgi:cell shape-determining protein MreC